MSEVTQTLEVNDPLGFDTTGLEESVRSSENTISSARRKKGKPWSLRLAKQKVVKNALIGMEWGEVCRKYPVLDVAKEHAPKGIKVETIAWNPATQGFDYEELPKQVSTKSLSCPFWEDKDKAFVYNLVYGNTFIFVDSDESIIQKKMPKSVSTVEDATKQLTQICAQLLETETYDKEVKEGADRIRRTIQGETIKK